MKDNDERELAIIANRMRFVHALRTTQEVQGKRLFYNEVDRTYCALGLYHYVVEGRARDKKLSITIRYELMISLGLSIFELDKIAVWNNSGSSFAAVADKFEEADFPICKADAPLCWAGTPRKQRNAEFRRWCEINQRFERQLREMRDGRITLTQWFGKYGGGPEGIEDRLTATQKKT